MRSRDKVVNGQTAIRTTSALKASIPAKWRGTGLPALGFAFRRDRHHMVRYRPMTRRLFMLRALCLSAALALPVLAVAPLPAAAEVTVTYVAP